ncbi:1014_t:CDS:2 [Ambispora leptoticha]|uniref:1014_t:CDS:1 n=1 Tax=Ambispora leptoticha TaxID=144679 RepID=A0A9N9ESX2_9GLOM|nr:1014_t:CDS:2 [Ambispora leptoticha]
MKNCGKKFDCKTAEEHRHDWSQNSIDTDEHEELNKNPASVKTMEDLPMERFMKDEFCQQKVGTIEELRKRIAELEAITSRTAEEEAELVAKKQELAELEKQQQEGGGKNKNRHRNKKIPNSQGRSCKDKIPVWGAVERGGFLIAEAVPNNQQSTLVPMVRGNIKAGSNVYSDELPAYEILVSTNTIESAWTPFKRSVYGIYHWISKKHAQRYVDEITFRYNTRKYEEKDRFDLALLSKDGTRLLASNSIQVVLKMVEEGEQKERGTNLSKFLGQKSLKPFVDKEKNDRTFEPVVFYDKGVKINGFKATTLVDVGNVYLALEKWAMRQGKKLPTRQAIIADQSRILLGALAKVSIDALIDEATVYKKLPDGVLDALKKKTPKNKRLHQSLTPEIGREHLKKQIYTVEALASISKTKEEFIRLMKEKEKNQSRQNLTSEKLDKEENQEVDFDKILKNAINTPPLKLKDLKEKLKKDREKKS